jgi:diaminopimelate decarboxylase
MRGFTLRGGELHADDVAVADIARAVETPTYVYSASAIRDSWARLSRAFAPLSAHFHYAVKASPNLQIYRLLRTLGAGMDVVSGGELATSPASAASSACGPGPACE